MRTAFSRISDMNSQQRAALAEEFDTSSRITVAEPVAVVGIGCRFPGNITGPDGYWQFLVDGRDAIEKARELKPDLIVLDFSMPGMNGLESARILSNMKPSAMILLFTMHRSAVADRDARAAGINAVVSKSEGAGILISQAQTLLGLS